jgi:hypothetical protein
MALKCSFKTNFGITVPEAYVRISEYTGNKSTVVFKVVVHANEEARQVSADPVYQSFYEAPLQEGNLMQNLYAHLKTFDLFKTGQDC